MAFKLHHTVFIWREASRVQTWFGCALFFSICQFLVAYDDFFIIEFEFALRKKAQKLCKSWMNMHITVYNLIMMIFNSQCFSWKQSFQLKSKIHDSWWTERAATDGRLVNLRLSKSSRRHSSTNKKIYFKKVLGIFLCFPFIKLFIILLFWWIFGNEVT